MGRNDWYQRSTWTKIDQREFFERNARSRGSESKSQYMRIQAHTLLRTGKPKLVRSALELVQSALSDYPDVSDVGLAYETAGRCCEFLGKNAEAIEYYLLAIDREREYPGIRTNAAFSLAKLAVENKRWDICSEALVAAESHGTPVFPWHAYLLYGARALKASHDGDSATGRQLAREALAAAEIENTGLSHGRGHLGTVGDTNTEFHRMLVNLATA